MKSMLSRIFSTTMVGLEPLKIEVEVDGTSGTPVLVIIGLANKSVDEAKERITSALQNCGVRIRAKRTVVNLAPADVHKTGSTLDLPIAVGILQMYGEIEGDFDSTLFFGEVSLDGSLKASRGALPRVLAARTMNFTRVVFPAANAPEVSHIQGIFLHPVAHLSELLTAFHPIISHRKPLQVLEYEPYLPTPPTQAEFRLSDIVGQHSAKRALQIAAAGGHNLMMVGPPGAGKSILSKAMVSLLPPLSEAEALEVTAIHSIAGLTTNQGFMQARPFRAPHHTTSAVGLSGGGSQLKPGEISLAHHGVLFLDELPEFSRESLETLRQPIEDRIITITRAQGTVTYPAHVSLIAAANPCPCGYAGSTMTACCCSPTQRATYTSRVSGPLLDRIDLHVWVSEVNISDITQNKESPESGTNDAVEQEVDSISTARSLQLQRYQSSGIFSNAELTTRLIKKYCVLPKDAKRLLSQASHSLKLSARSYFRTIKVARTIADLAGTDQIELCHVAEALHYRPVVWKGE